jgi:beta-glucosidase
MHPCLIVNERQALLALMALLSGSACAASAGSAKAQALDERVDALLARMTIEEKTLIHGAREPAATDQGQAGFWPGLPQFGIPLGWLWSGIENRVILGIGAV